MHRRLIAVSSAVALVVVAIAVLVATHDAVVALSVVAVGLLVAVLGLTLWQHRGVEAQLGTTRRRLRTVLATVERVEARQNHAARHDQVVALINSNVQQQRQIREESAELSREVAHLLTHVKDLRVSQEQVLQHLAAVAPAPGNPERGRAVDQRAVVGEQMFDDLRFDGPTPSVVLTLDSFTPGQLFAGVRTAVLAAVHAATTLHRPLRVIVMRQPKVSGEEATSLLAEWIASEASAPALAPSLVVSLPDAPQKSGHHPDDVWIATYWGTAQAIGNLVDDGLVSPSSVLYVVQDWEPGFFPWGTEFALARATHERGFSTVVNSRPLAEFIRAEARIAIDPDCVFAPQVSEPRLREAAALWRPSEDAARPRVLFYARPSKPRNLYSLGVLALRAWVAALPDGVRPVVTVAGEDVDRLDLGPGADVVLAGKLSLNDYYELLSRQDMALALMHSPHPSHLPLELPMAGIPTVTNTLGGYRRSWLPGLHLAAPSPADIAAGLEAAREEAAQLRVHSPQALPADLGVPLPYAVSSALSLMKEAAR